MDRHGPLRGRGRRAESVDRGQQSLKRSRVVDGHGIPLGVVLAPANVHDSPLLAPTLASLAAESPLAETTTVHLDRGYDSNQSRATLAGHHLTGATARRGRPAPLQAGERWVVERTTAWHNAFHRLARCTARRQRVIACSLAVANAVIIVRRLVREGRKRYRWATRPPVAHDRLAHARRRSDRTRSTAPLWS
ncbi:MAG TPA: transposase [Candidatus Micrarchaeia archaeon]|nr:transposase [Candidatus Micrarchaeia archaeon]